MNRILTALAILLFGAAIANAESNLWYTSYSSQAIYTYGLTSGSNKVFALMPLAGKPVFDSSGNLFVTGGNGTDFWIWKFTAGAGNGSLFTTLPAQATGMTIDSSDNLYVAAGGAIYKFDTSAVRTTLATGLSIAPPGRATGLVMSGTSVLMSNGGTIYKITSSGTISVLASNLTSSAGLAIRGAFMYIAVPDTGNGSAAIEKQNTGGGNVTTFASGGYLNNPQGAAFDALNNLYVANNDGHPLILVYDTNGTNTATIAVAQPPLFITAH